METVRNRRLEVLLGLALAFALAAGVVLVYRSFRGGFSRDYSVTARIAQAGDALEVGDIVTYRDIVVGRVTGATGEADGSARLTLRIDRDRAAAIPASVTAVAVPSTIFGATQVNLLPGRTTAGPGLRDGADIAADTSPAAESLQTALANAYTLLTAVRPAQLDAALSALATALDGQGGRIGELVDRADTYLETLVPMLPQLDTTITSFATVTRQLARNAPALLDSVRDLIVAAKGVVANQRAFSQLLNVAPTALDNVQLLLNGRNVDNAVTVVRDQRPVLEAVAADPRALPQTIAGFKTFADVFAGPLSHGPYLQANIILTGANLAALFNLAVDQQGRVFQSVTDPPGYTAADCPRYPGLAGPGCGGTASTSGAGQRLLTQAPATNGTVGGVGGTDELAAVRATAGLLAGVPAARVPDLADLYLGPLLRGAVTVVR